MLLRLFLLQLPKLISLFIMRVCVQLAQEFFIEYLDKLYDTDLINIVNLRLVPWGNAETVGHDKTIVCKLYDMYVDFVCNAYKGPPPKDCSSVKKKFADEPVCYAAGAAPPYHYKAPVQGII
ncbi:hypothetical protein HS088_TW13G00135 [Tripterygium wilfordii]|uniref:Uncharacterized protein n=1 Tax=Tripterygium wilfordii TaxID=458696 RepID=A0A7J7CTN7_TRIWF|nr:hypothetical protein HS088_TW13G00135 [Tripterygium wilfordii]